MACPDPGIRPGLYRNGTIELGETVVYSCLKAGYNLVGDKNRTCVYLGEENGTGWTGSVPICEGNTSRAHLILSYLFVKFIAINATK